MKNYIYLHICCINNWKDIVKHLFANIKSSGLYDIIDEIRCVVLGTNDDVNYINDNYDDDKKKIKIIYQENNFDLYEFKIMELIYQDSLKEDFNILYIHSKGVKYYGLKEEECVKDWVNYLIYFNIENYKICLNYLNNYDAVGVNLQLNPVCHYSGNFWWSKSEHIKTLGLIEDKSYNGPEFYITKKKEGKYIGLWTSYQYHYNYRYSRENYLNKININYINNHEFKMII